ncbi:hypothetical protein [Amycolatopsis sp. BJA-103]|uniref:hypothetical protein n=1 Tax=Amycolatopsis sp. BJA-103 TaxID=1911175 RepID=UPI000C755CCA|nr:hypothetical protein [Amycolatopsis sp. BJA-103]AUI61958.1 hypothetical protein BKN51_29830 [Amycolatopsis sp. BJA-103]PNE20746.1 hypothetical protein B1H26_02605 [Amycolatopsis sp. BJA-103]
MSIKRSTRVLALAGSLAALPFMLPGVAAADPAIAPVDLGTLPGDLFSEVNAINDHGVMVGSSTPLEPQIKHHATRWDAQGRITALAGLGGEQSEANDVNEHGVAVGWAHKDPARNQTAVKWAPDGAVTALPSLPGGDYAYANEISGTGVVVGTGNGADGKAHALRWNADGTVVALGDLDGDYGSALWITRDGRTIGGTATDAAGRNHAVRWNSEGVITDLSPGIADSTPEDMNDNGVIVGSARLSGDPKPVRWEQDGRTTWLEHPEIWPAWASAVNDAGVAAGGGYQVFGTTNPARWDGTGARTTLSTERGLGNDIDSAGTVVGLENEIAAKWDASGTRTVLGALPGGTYSNATHIAANGVIAGISYNEEGRSHAVYWPKTQG